MRSQASWRVVVLVTIIGWSLTSSDARAQSENVQDGTADNVVDDSYTAVTTIDPLIPIESLRILVKPLTKEELEVETEITREIKRRFDQAGISIPLPQRDVHVYTQAAGKGESFTPSAD